MKIAIAKARLRRLASAIPLVGAGAAVYFERQTYYEWRELYPEGSAEDYACDMAALTAEVLDEVLEGLPATVRPPGSLVRGFVPECTNSAAAPPRKHPPAETSGGCFLRFFFISATERHQEATG